jgi:hypothetical protein
MVGQHDPRLVSAALLALFVDGDIMCRSILTAQTVEFETMRGL